MVCIGCGAKLAEPAVFPGGTVRCACGTENVVLPPPAASPPAAGPYREAAPVAPVVEHTGEATMLACPFCGGPCTQDARACPHCSVELAAVRCPRCFALHFTGARFCSQCRAELHAEPLLDASDAPCPRCARPLGTTRDAGVFECAACGGLFVDHTAFATLAAEKEAEAKPFAARAPHAPPSKLDAEVHYVKCPVCGNVMNRINFGHRSGVIVNVCGHHGTWFDAGELTRVLEWIATGALADERAREQAENAREAASRERERSYETAHVPVNVGWGADEREETVFGFLRFLEEMVRSRFRG